MNQPGKARIGHKAPDFHCDAVIKGLIEEKSLSSYISPSKPQWLIILFIPAAFSFVCPTEVLAFQNCLDEFRDRNCDVVFVSVDTKHSLWHWQNVPRQYGGLGQTDIALLSDASHKMSRDYGVLIEEEGVCLRGLFILDDKAIVQQVTLNNLTVGRSVLEALRLLEAFQAVAKHGVLCPIDWKPSTNTSETINTISNTLTESYDERLANLQKEFGDTPLTDLDAKHKSAVGNPASIVTPAPTSTPTPIRRRGSASTTSMVTRSLENPNNIGVTMTHNASGKAREDIEKQRVKDLKDLKDEETSHIPTPVPSTDCLPHRSRDYSSISQTVSAPVPTPTQFAAPPPTPKKPGFGGTARHSRGHTTAPFTPHSHGASHPALHKPNTFESRRGTQIILEFADPTSSPQGSPSATPSLAHPLAQSLSNSPLSTPSDFREPYPQLAPCLSNSSSSPSPLSPTLSRSGSQMRHDCAVTPPVVSAAPSPRGGAQTRMQATFEAIKKVSTGLSSPRVDFSPRKSGDAKKEEGKGGSAGTEGKQEGEWGYFDVVPEVVDA